MTIKNPSDRFIPFTNTVTDEPVLMIDSQASLRDLHACVSERLHTVLNYLTLMACTSLPDYAERDINTVANVARLMVQDITDVFGVIEMRGMEKN
ncbi:fructose-bisphosphate aldolase [Pseudomonas sp. H11T01]|uniref:fructose-bisphosphate aldolase n=1 Tax=Pseudomonas sp. H11T01 TaxID=3402749 RepID=UPI003AC13C44